MAKSLCKYRRIEIADKFAEISKIVSTPNFICSSCARVASDKTYLCKPSALTSQLTTSPIADSAVSKSEVQVHLSALEQIEQTESAISPVVTKKQAKQLKAIAKVKNKRLKKAAKAVKRYDKALQKAKRALQL
ncbi:hypothetical protein [Photobacterium minamisatsumaniensis]|uniref:hypothetical protein n=1 Tax=Photobacterium minamisatsumaniensis TaxID=2910233 RepID=UPI003D0F90AC